MKLNEILWVDGILWEIEGSWHKRSLPHKGFCIVWELDEVHRTDEDDNRTMVEDHFSIPHNVLTELEDTLYSYTRPDGD